MKRSEIENNVLEFVKNKIDKNFEFRPYQFDAIVDIISDCLEGKNNNYICEAPTGSGKSLINIISTGVLFDYYKIDSYILCSDLYLFSQYEDFIVKHPKLKFGYLKGQTGNYNCRMNGHDIRSAECQMSGMSWQSLIKPSEKDKKLPCAGTCKYVQDRKRAMNAGVTVMTYQLFLFMVNVVPRLWKDSQGKPCQPFKPRKAMFMDECHNIPTIVQNNASPIISDKDFPKFINIYNAYRDLFGNKGEISEETIAFNNSAYDESFMEVDPKLYKKHKTGEKLYKYLSDIYKNLQNCSENKMIYYLEEYHSILGSIHGCAQVLMAEIQSTKQFGVPLPKDKQKLWGDCVFVLNSMCICSDFLTCVSETSPKYIVREHIENDQDLFDTSLVFHCVKEDFMVYWWLLRYTKFRFFTSATVGGQKAFDENNGIAFTNEKISKFTKIPSSFDFSKSPIYFVKKFKMNYANKHTSIPQISKLINDILSKYHKNERGIIQTGSYEIANIIYRNLTPENRSRVLLYRGSKEKEQMISEHKIKKNTILMGPTVQEGIDLPGDLCRFIIICKIPYPSLGSPYVKAKQEIFPTWYNSTTANAVIQGIGRGNRFVNDYCKTYILDGCFDVLFRQTKEQFPEELTKRILA